MTLREALIEGTRELEEAHIPDSKFDARILLLHASNITYSRFLASSTDPMEEDSLRKYRTYLKMRTERIPLQHITGEQDFMGYSFRVNEHVLIPRQDTETLVLLAEEEIKKTDAKKVLDLCTGSGCIGISLFLRMKEAGRPIDVTLSDLSEEALAVAKENANLLNTNICFTKSDLFEEIDSSYDVIVSNPPYIPSHVIPGLMPEVRDHDPMMALDGGEDGLFIYRKLIPQAYERLQDKGSLFLEIGYDQGGSVSLIMREAGFNGVTVAQDLAGNDRVVYGRK
ncbi:MAG: peptide chain release factor N(5)-glutamine methyltransferase [Lachnospiraceae bacterium]|nr:peptide chain release factor N(5)-glutamine methyltransferase [Lachnospiraceae bacterium]